MVCLTRLGAAAPRSVGRHVHVAVHHDGCAAQTTNLKHHSQVRRPSSLAAPSTSNRRSQPPMAPSRAVSRFAANLLSTRRCAAVAAAHARPMSLTRSYAQLLFPHPRPALLSSAVSLQQCPAAARRNMSATAAPEPPDFLSEGELHVFNKIKDKLEPVRLEVRKLARAITLVPRRLREMNCE